MARVFGGNHYEVPMKIEILGCSGSVAKGYNTTSILINGSVLIDAGSAASTLSEERQSAIRHILITHPHLDHIKELPFILDTLFSQTTQGVTVWGSEETIHALNDNIFNGIIWPEIKELNNHKDLFSTQVIPSCGFTAGGIMLEPIPVKHIPGSLCFKISEGDGHVLISGDTGYDQALFDIAGSLGTALKALFIEVSFPNKMEDFARLTHHITPMILQKGIACGVPSTTRVVAYHIKPKYIDEVVAELPPNVAYITGGEVFEF